MLLFASPAPTLSQLVRQSDLRKSSEVFFLNLEDGFFGCQVNASVDVLQLFEISKLCDGTPHCYRGSDESNPNLKCTSKLQVSFGEDCLLTHFVSSFQMTVCTRQGATASTARVWIPSATATMATEEKVVICPTTTSASTGLATSSGTAQTPSEVSSANATKATTETDSTAKVRLRRRRRRAPKLQN